MFGVGGGMSGLTKRERGTIVAERYLEMAHDCRALGIPGAHCPLHEGEIRDDPVTKERVVSVELSYPPYETEIGTPDQGVHPSTFEIGLLHVRAADNIRVSYDFARDGWSIKQASTFSWPADSEVYDEDWQEVAFVKARARQRGEDGG
jgi:hypothetical protein